MKTQLTIWILLVYETRLMNGICDANEWTPIEGENKSVIISNKPADHLTAEIICSNLGATLLTIKSPQTHDQLTRIYKGVKCGYWLKFGLTREDDGVLRWSDGTILEAGDYSRLEENFTAKLTCAQTRFCPMEPWQPTNCWLKRFFLCESVAPCKARPRLTIESGQTIENGVATFISEQAVTLNCRFLGYSEDIKNFSINCNGNPVYAGPSDKELRMTFFMGLMMDGVVCECITSSSSGGVESNTVRMQVHTSPKLDEKSINFTSIIVTEGLPISIEFGVYANPVPNKFTLQLEGSVFSPLLYDVDTQRKRRNSHCIVLLIIFELKLNESGRFNLSLSNGILEALHFPFNVKVEPVPEIVANVKSAIEIVGTVFMCLVVFMMSRICYGGFCHADDDWDDDIDYSIVTECDYREDEQDEPITPITKAQTTGGHLKNVERKPITPITKAQTTGRYLKSIPKNSIWSPLDSNTDIEAGQDQDADDSVDPVKSDSHDEHVLTAEDDGKFNALEFDDNGPKFSYKGELLTRAASEGP